MTVSADNPKKSRAFTPARIAALAFIGLAVLALGYLRFAPDAGSVSVPRGAHAGQLNLHSCHYATDKGSYAADCGTLVVPENRAEPQSTLIALPVTRIRARSASPGVPVFRLEGGPGLTNMKFSKASRFAGKRIDLLSESAGTRTAMIYAWRYPKSIQRSVMLDVNPPGNFLWHAKTTNEQIRNYSALCAKDNSCRERTDDLAATIKRTRIPDHWFFLPIKKGNVRIASFYGLMESTSEAAPISAPMTLGAVVSADHGDASGFWFQS